ncbi:MAG: SurA N-terminal domain-containing protein [Deltaproteobacteria bacterium]|nr:SurA N-terminal domain-containing protein [Deltaproteobacteria bacterium]
MSVIGRIRKGTETGTVKVIFFVVVVVFLFWGIGQSSGPESTVVAEVNGERITDTRYHQAMRNTLHGQRRAMDEDEQVALARQVLSNLILQEVLLQEAHRLGVEVSNEEQAEYILSHEAFQDESGRFNEELYERALKRSGSNRSQFERDIYNQMVLGRLEGVALSAMALKKEDLRRAWLTAETRLSLEVVRVPALFFYDDVQPTEVEVDTWIAEHGADIHARYQEEYNSRYFLPMRATVREILLKTGIGDVTLDDLRIRMASLRKEAEAGADFSDLARRWSEAPTAADGGSLGEIRADTADPDVARVVFGDEGANPAPGLRSVLEAKEGLVLLQVDTLLPEDSIPEEQVRSEIALRMLRELRAPEMAAAFAEQVRTAWKEQGVVPSDLLAAQSLVLETPEPVSLAHATVPGLPHLPDLAAALPQAQPGQVLETPFRDGDTWYVVRLENRIDPDPARFEEVLPLVRTRLEMEARAAFVRTWEDDLVARASVKQYYKPRPGR